MLAVPEIVGPAINPRSRDRMEATCHIDVLRPLSETLGRRVVEQGEAIDPSRPLLTALLLGPTGVGKTETARSVAQALFSSDRDLTRVNCEEYGHPLSVILFDEIEKAHPLVWNSLLGILDDGMLTLGDNSTTDFTRSIVLMTSNVGSREMSDLLDHRQVGFGGGDIGSQATKDSLRELALAAARKSFPFEFLNRFDEIMVYSPLEYQHLELIFDKFLVDIHDRALGQAGVPLLLKVAPEAKDHIIALGTDLRFGARPLRRAIEHELVDPLSRFIASQKLHAGDVVEVELEQEQLAFFRS